MSDDRRTPAALQSPFVRPKNIGKLSENLASNAARRFCNSFHYEGRHIMAKFALYAHLKAKPGKTAEVEAFLKSALPLAQQEPGTITWYAFSEDGAGSYGIFDTFDTEAGRQAHLDGPIAKALMAKAGELLAEPPAIHKITLLADKH